MNENRARNRLMVGHLSMVALSGYFVVYLVLCFIAFSLRGFPGEPALIWPAAGLYLPCLALFRIRYWPYIVAASYLAELVAELIWTGTLDYPLTLVFSAINAIEAMIGGLIFFWLVPTPWYRRHSLELSAYLFLCSVLAPMVGGFLSAQVIQVTTGSIPAAVAEFGAWWSGDFLGIMLVAPVFGAIVLRRTVGTQLTRQALYRTIAFCALAICAFVLLIGSNAFAGELPTTLRFGSALLLLLLVLSWSAIRAEPIIVATVGCLFALLVSACLSIPGTPIREAIGENRELIEAVLLLVFACSLSAFIVSITFFERHNVRRLLELRENAGLLMSNVAVRLSYCEPENLDTEIYRCLEKVGLYANADRCIIFDVSADATLVHQTASWVREGVPDTRSISTNIPVESISDVFEGVRAGRTQFVRPDDYPADHPGRKLFRRGGMREGLYSPIISADHVKGAVALIWVRQVISWPADLIMILQSLGQSIGRARTRVQGNAAAEQYRSRLRLLANELNRVDDRVRRETATDLHDGAAQQLAVSRIKLGQLGKSNPDIAEALGNVDTMVADALTQIRDVIDKLAPTALYDLGLLPALQELALNASREFDTRITVSAEDSLFEPSENFSAILYRATRELVTNCLKHANASEIAIRLEQQDGYAILRVSDNGSGIELAKPNDAGQTGNGLGLFNLRERVKHLGGRLKIESSSSGTTVSFSLPHVIADDC